MKNARRPLGTFLGVALATAMLAACGSGGDDSTATASDCEAKYTFPTVEKGKLTVAAPQYPPAFSQTGNNTPTGIDAEFLIQFAKDSCLEPQWEIIPQAGAIESVKNGRADIAAGNWYATDERAKIVNQTNPLFVDRPTWASKSGDSNINAFKGKNVGTVTGYLWVDELRKLFGDNLKLYNSPDAVFADLKAGRIDAALFGSVEISYILSQSPAPDIKTAPMDPDPAIKSSVEPYLPNYPHTKGNTQLTEALNSAIDAARADGSIARILENNGLDPSLADVSGYVK